MQEKKLNSTYPVDIRRENGIIHKISAKVINDILKENQSTSLSLKKLKYQYEQKDHNLRFSVGILRNFVRKEMKAKYRRPTFKTYKSLKNKNLKQLSLFLKKICEVLRIEGEVLFFDETKIQNFTNTQKRWVFPDYNELISFPGKLKSSNLLLTVHHKGYLYYQIKDDNNNSDDVIKYLKELAKSLQASSEFSDTLEKGKLWLFLDKWDC